MATVTVEDFRLQRVANNFGTTPEIVKSAEKLYTGKNSYRDYMFEAVANLGFVLPDVDGPVSDKEWEEILKLED